MADWIKKLKRKAKYTHKRITNEDILKLYEWKDNDIHKTICMKYIKQCVRLYDEGKKQARDFLHYNDILHRPKHIAGLTIEYTPQISDSVCDRWSEIVFSEFRPLPYWVVFPNRQVWKHILYCDNGNLLNKEEQWIYRYMDIYHCFVSVSKRSIGKEYFGDQKLEYRLPYYDKIKDDIEQFEHKLFGGLFCS